MYLAHLFEKLDTVETGHIVVGDDAINVVSFEIVERFFGIEFAVDRQQTVILFEQRGRQI